MDGRTGTVQALATTSQMVHTGSRGLMCPMALAPGLQRWQRLLLQIATLRAPWHSAAVSQPVAALTTHLMHPATSKYSFNTAASSCTHALLATLVLLLYCRCTARHVAEPYTKRYSQWQLQHLLGKAGTEGTYNQRLYRYGISGAAEQPRDLDAAYRSLSQQ